MKAIGAILETKEDKKCLVLTVSRYFFKGHPIAGAPTDFPLLIIKDEKIHTIRADEKGYWKKVVDKVNSGKYYLSIRTWSGKPYASKQSEVTRVYSMNYQEIYMSNEGIMVDDRMLTLDEVKTLAANDGLSVENFEGWFRKLPFKGCILHFTNKVY